MAETNAVPKISDIEAIRADILIFLVLNNSIESYAKNALTRFKMDLEDKKSIQFKTIFDTVNDEYFEGSDGERNKPKCFYMLGNLIVSMVFRDYAAKQGEASWWDLANEYEARYDAMLNRAKLDVDMNEDGLISDGEMAARHQPFFRA